MTMGPYFLLAVCSGGSEIRSNGVYPNIVKGIYQYHISLCKNLNG